MILKMFLKNVYKIIVFITRKKKDFLLNHFVTSYFKMQTQHGQKNGVGESGVLKHPTSWRNSLASHSRTSDPGHTKRGLLRQKPHPYRDGVGRS